MYKQTDSECLHWPLRGRITDTGRIRYSREHVDIRSGTCVPCKEFESITMKIFPYVLELQQVYKQLPCSMSKHSTSSVDGFELALLTRMNFISL